MNIKLLPFTVPCYVTAAPLAGLRQEGFKETPTWSLSEVDALELDQLCNDFRKEVFRKADKKDPIYSSYGPHAPPGR